MSAHFLLYFADPMCSWCYGFGPELDGLLRERADLRVQLVMGGLRAYHNAKADPAFRETIAVALDNTGSLIQAVRTRSSTVATKHVNTALMQPHWRDHDYWIHSEDNE